ncbi:MAG: type II toxin-antitoxin system VapC family toxin [Kiritimatiellae bacterium]|nr:type II toxin-antitoxin system VapC family toxin [Kiritimatiellia bacterium]
MDVNPKVYIETTVVSYLTGRATRDLMVAARREETRSLWPRLVSEFRTYISALVYEEAGSGNEEQAQKRLAAIEPFPVLDIDQESRDLAARLLADKAIPKEFPEDAVHIAVAAVNGIDVLLTWNFAHINNPFKKMLIRQVVESSGYRCPEICSPDELMEASQ